MGGMMVGLDLQKSEKDRKKEERNGLCGLHGMY
jgi:hypothetical protein